MSKSSKICQLCGVNKPLSEYHKNKQIKDGKHTICKICNRRKVKQWRLDNPEKYKSISYRRGYGLTYSCVEKLKKSCNYRCEICGIKESDAPRGKLFVDHCHDSNKVRGMLCLHCNNLLGSCKDSIETLKSAIRFLEENGS